MKTVCFRGREYTFETARERDERLDLIAQKCVEAIAPTLNGLNVHEINDVIRQMQAQCYSLCKVSSVGISNAET